MKKYLIKFLMLLMIIYFHNVSSSYAQNYINSIEQFGNKPNELMENFYDPKSHNPQIERPEKTDESLIDVTSAIKFKVKRFIYNGNITFSDTDQKLKDIEVEYLNKDITFEDLLKFRKELTELYINEGYINSGVILPNQKFKNNGEVIFQVFNGELSVNEPCIQKSFKADNDELSKNKKCIHESKYSTPINPNYIKKRLELGVQKPLNIKRLEKQFKLLIQNPLIRNAKAKLKPTDKLGRAVLDVQVIENDRCHFNVLMNNHRSPSIGAYRLELNASNINVFGWGHTLYLKAGGTMGDHSKSGMSDFSFFYNYLLNERDLSVTFQYYQSNARVIEEPFNLVDITSQSRLYEIGLIRPFYFLHPFIRDILLDDDNTSISFQMGLKSEKKDSKTQLFGKGYSFSEGPENGVSRIFAFNFSQSLLVRSQRFVFALNSCVKLGMDAMGATINEQEDIPDGNFFSYIAQIQWVQKFDIFNLKNIKFIIRSDFQYANDSLLSMEKFSLGGATTVRGYRENQFICDKAITSSIELRFPISFSKLNTEIATFFDSGRGKNNNKPEELSKLSSAGIGILCNYKKINSKIYWGKAFSSINEQNNDNIDRHDQWHFQINYHYNY